MMLGDHANAHRWLQFAYAVERENPGTLKPAQRAELDRRLRQLAQAMGVDVPAGAVVVPGPTEAPVMPPPASPIPAP
jgi:hypothetical protein